MMTDDSNKGHKLKCFDMTTEQIITSCQSQVAISSWTFWKYLVVLCVYVIVSIFSLKKNIILYLGNKFSRTLQRSTFTVAYISLDKLGLLSGALVFLKMQPLNPTDVYI